MIRLRNFLEIIHHLCQHNLLIHINRYQHFLTKKPGGGNKTVNKDIYWSICNVLAVELKLSTFTCYILFKTKLFL